MKLSSRTQNTFMTMFLLWSIVGTLAWELLVRVLALFGPDLDLSVGPVGFDVEVVRLYVQFNPGTLAGVILAVILFRRS